MMIAAFGIIATMLLGLGSWLGGRDSPLLARQDPAGRGMFGAFTLLAFWVPGLLLAATALVLLSLAPRVGALDLVCGLAPVVLVGGIFVVYRARRRRREREVDAAA